MPLPKAAARKLMHTRTIDCRGYEREDGLWDIEGRLSDIKSYTWKNRDGDTPRISHPHFPGTGTRAVAGNPLATGTTAAGRVRGRAPSTHRLSTAGHPRSCYD